MLAHRFFRNDNVLMPIDRLCPKVWVKMLLSSIERGNAVHHRLHHAAFDLDVGEALHVLGREVSVGCGGILNVWMNQETGTCPTRLLESQLRHQSELSQCSVAVVVRDTPPKFAIFSDGNCLMVVASHDHGQHGALFACGSVHHILLVIRQHHLFHR